MTRLPDAPLDEPPLPPLQVRFPWQLNWKFVCVILLVTSGVAVVLAPSFIHPRRGGCGQREHVNNARQIGIALFEFETEYGRYPDASTVAAVRKETGTLLPLGTNTSNDFFRQLIATGIASSEPMFHAKIKGTHRPDGRMDPAHALSKGEVGFTYLAGLEVEGNPSRPIVVAPVIPGTDRFDPKPFDGKAVVLKMDNSVTSLPIQKDGRVLFEGKNILAPSHPVWEGKPPVVAWPDL